MLGLTNEAWTERMKCPPGLWSPKKHLRANSKIFYSVIDFEHQKREKVMLCLYSFEWTGNGGCLRRCEHRRSEYFTLYQFLQCCLVLCARYYFSEFGVLFWLPHSLCISALLPLLFCLEISPLPTVCMIVPPRIPFTSCNWLLLPWYVVIRIIFAHWIHFYVTLDIHYSDKNQTRGSVSRSFSQRHYTPCASQLTPSRSPIPAFYFHFLGFNSMRIFYLRYFQVVCSTLR